LLVLHAPERGEGGHVHHVELDRVIGPGYLLTVHGPVNPAVADDVAVRDTRDVLARIRAGRLHPTTPFDVSHAVVSTLTRRMEAFVEELTRDVWELERRVTAGAYDDPERFLDEMFRTRHGLLAVRTIAAQTAEIYRRVATIPHSVPETSRHLVVDLIDQFDRIAGLAGEERDYLQGVIEFYRARTETKMTIAAERLAVIAVVTLPITALASVLGMNLIYYDHTTGFPLVAAIAVMLAMSSGLLLWARRQGWW
ncbi:MAG TPA: CorA family divalent cation transporter, partial [Cellulomonas sp.]|nr:CorA family divalent cation transporter [Cellulomonas sp.]